MVDGLPVGGDTGNPLPKEGQGGCPAHASIIPLTRVGILVEPYGSNIHIEAQEPALVLLLEG